MARLRLRQPRGQPARIRVGITACPRARQACGVDERGVVEPVFIDRVVAAAQTGDHSEIRHVTGREQQRALGPDEVGQLFFQFVMGAIVAADQMRGAGTRPGLGGAAGQRRGHARVARQPEIVVAAKGQQSLTVDRYFDAGRRVDHQPLPEQPGLASLLYFRGGIFHDDWPSAGRQAMMGRDSSPGPGSTGGGDTAAV